MKRLATFVLVLLILAFSGCTAQDASGETESQIFDRANLNLNGKMMDIELSPKDARAGENITLNLVVGNTGTENINRETIEIDVKAKSIDDILVNIALMAMSESKKTMTFTKEYNDDIRTGMIKPLSYVFPTPRELRGRNLAGKYDVTVILSVNGQTVESKTVTLRLRSGKPRDGAQAPSPAQTVAALATVSSTATATASSTTAPTETPSPTPTPTPAEEQVVVDTFVFGWDDVPGKDTPGLLAYLKKKFGVDWVDSATVEKDASDYVINITSVDHYISLTLNEGFRDELTITIDDGRKSKLTGIMDGKLKIYSGVIRLTRIQGWKFTENSINIDAGSWLQWQNMDYADEPQFTLTEVNGKLSNITVRSRKVYYFNTTGTYKFDLYYPKMRTPPTPQTITVRLNQSQ